MSSSCATPPPSRQNLPHPLAMQNFGLTSSGRIATLKHTCDRCNRTHLFEYDGPNPLEGLATLVGAHAVECGGRNSAATQTSATNSKATPSIRQMNTVKPRTGPHVVYSYGLTVPTAPRIVGATGPNSGRQQPFLTSSPRSTPNPPANKNCCKSISRRKRRAASTSDADAEEYDPLELRPKKVVCRTCRKAICDDRRAAHSSGHNRGSCAAVKKRRTLQRDNDRRLKGALL
ncbi:hypothetical protein C8R43DRAFT_613316 [Mycena crocata]|nr:hypothetical protein C8R43DRAFT_613316 [Mycena crocata]